MPYPLGIFPTMSQQPKNNSPGQAEKDPIVQKTTVENASKQKRYLGEFSMSSGGQVKSWTPASGNSELPEAFDHRDLDHRDHKAQGDITPGQGIANNHPIDIPRPSPAQSNRAPGEKYFAYSRMDDNNKKMMDVMATKGPAAAADAMMKECGYSYSEMRDRYG